MDVETSHVVSVGDLVRQVKARPKNWGGIWFRGQADAGWHLEPKVHRNARDLKDRSGYETNLTHRFRGRAPLLGADMDTDRNAAWLQTMQHHGLPTRLLDWSRSPLVAADFAIENAITHPEMTHPDAVIWCLDPHGLNQLATTPQDSITPSIESGLARALIDGAFYGDESARRSATTRRRRWKSRQARSVGERFDPASDDHDPPKILAVMASESDVRMVVQQGAFTVHGLDTPELNRIEGAGDCLRRLVVPADAILEFAAQVEACGFGEAGIYPDLDHLSSELTRTGRHVGKR